MSAAFVFVRAIESATEVSSKCMMLLHLVHLLLAHVGDDRPACAEWNAGLGIPLLLPLPPVPVHFDIDDWSMVEAVRTSLREGRMRVEQITLRDGGRESHGIVGVVRDRLLMSVTAALGDEPLFVRIGRFDGSLAFHDGVLDVGTEGASAADPPPHATRSKRKKVGGPRNNAERRALARARRGAATARQHVANMAALSDIAPPFMAIRVVPEPIKIGGSDVLAPLLMGIKLQKRTDGRNELAALTRRIQEVLGVQMVLALCRLKVELGARERVKEALAKTAKADVDHLLRIGRKEIVNYTGYDTEDDVERVTKAFHAEMEALDQRAYEQGRQNRIAAEHMTIAILAKAIGRARKVLAAFDEAMKREFDEKSREGFRMAYNDLATDMPIDEIIQVAMYADVDPSQLWLQYAREFATIFVIARFVGRVRNGAAAELGCDAFAAMRQVLCPGPSEERGWLNLTFPLREVVRHCFSIKRFLLAMHVADLEGGFVKVPRATRELIVVTPSMRCHRISNADEG
jgi:hypothetical protein